MPKAPLANAGGGDIVFKAGIALSVRRRIVPLHAQGTAVPGAAVLQYCVCDTAVARSLERGGTRPTTDVVNALRDPGVTR